jgi:hypothetical protein
MKRLFLFNILILLIILPYYIILPDIRFVSKTGTSKPPYISWETASDSIQKCINVCSSGDTIYVANGTYTEKIKTIRGLTLIGSGPDSCIIDERTISFDIFHAFEVTDSCNIQGFQVVVSETKLGTAFYCQGKSILIKNNKINKVSTCIISIQSELEINNNYLNNSFAGISINESKTKCYNNIIVGSEYYAISMGSSIPNTEIYISNNTIDLRGINSAEGISISIGTKPTITNNIILLDGSFSRAFNGGGSDTVRFYNNLIYSRNADLFFNGTKISHIINNNLFYGPNRYSGLLLQGNSHTTVNNAIVNAGTGIETDPNTTSRIQYNNSYNNITNYKGFTPDSTNLSVDPMIVNADSLDFHLQMSSPLIDRGDPAILDPDSTRSDIGLYGGMLYGQSYKYKDYPPQPPKGLTAVKDSLTITLYWKANTEADFNHYLLYRDTTAGFIADSTKLFSQLTVNGYIQPIPQNTNRLYYKLKAVDNQGKVSGLSDEIGVVITGIAENENNIIQNYRLYQNYPNPFNPSTLISYRLKEEGYVKLTVYDIKGERVSVLVNERKPAGYYEVEFSGKSRNESSSLVDRLASGIYIYRLEITGRNNIPVFTDVKKMLYLK